LTATCHPPFALTALAFPEMTRCARFTLPPRPGTALMPFIVDDRFHSHAKALRASLAARGLWTTAGSWSADHGTEGVVPLHVVAALGGTPELVAELTAPGGLWEGRAEEVEFHDWEYWNTLPGDAGTPVTALSAVPAAGDAGRTTGARKAALRRAPGLKPKVRARDGDCCRYCGTAVRWGAGQAADSGAYDWVEPGGPAAPENVVTACMACRGAKAGRSPKDAGMTLLAPPYPVGRTPSRTPSELEQRDNPPSRTPSEGAAEGDRSPSAGKTADQKRYTPESRLINSIRSNSGVVGSKGSVPVQDARAREDPDVIAAAIGALNEVTGRTDIGEPGALHAIDVILRRRPKGGRRRTLVPAYFRTVILKEADPYAELVPGPAPPAEWTEPEPVAGAHPFRNDAKAGPGVCLDCPRQKSHRVHRAQPPSLQETG
jgi:hypothetical protein